MQKILEYFKKNTTNVILFIAAMILIFNADAKALLSQGLMKLGFYQPDIQTEIPVSTSESNYYLDLVDANGNAIQLENLKGKIVFINFWATWCPPCIAEMPSIQKLYSEFESDQEVVFLLVEMDDKPQKAIQFMEKKGYSLPVHTPTSRVSEELFQGNLPTTVILDKKGNIVHKTIGMADYSGEEFVEFIRKLK